MLEQIERHYHGCKIISIQNEKFVAGSDGWKHYVSSPHENIGEYDTLSRAVQVAKESASISGSKVPVTTDYDEAGIE